MAARCLTAKSARALARAKARKTGDKVSIWKCAPRCFKVGEAPRGRCRWRAWALPSLP